MSERLGEQADVSNKSKTEISQEDAILQGEKSSNDLQNIRKLEENDDIAENLKNSLYEGLGLSEDLESNSDVQKFVKGIVDGLILDNVELISQLLESGIDEFLELLQKFLDPELIWELIKSICDDLGDIMNTFQKPYDGGMAVGGMGLGVLGKGMKGFKLFGKMKGDSIDGNTAKKMDFGAINNNDPSKFPLKKMFEQSKYEVDMINNPKSNLLGIMKGIDLGDRQVLEMLNRRANKWIEARVKNMTNMLNYSVKHPGDMAKYNEMIVNGGFNEILDQINTQTKSGVLKMTNANLETIRLVKKQINNLK